MAHSLADCDRVIGAAQGSARLQIGFMRRYDPAYAEAKRLIAAGALGEPLLIRAVHRDREATHLPAESGVTDMMFESTIHDFDLSRFFFGDEIASVTTTASVLCHARGTHGHAPNAALSSVRFAEGALADIETYWGALYAYDVRMEVVCAEGTAMIGVGRQTALAVLTPGGATHDLFPGFLERFAEAYRAEVSDFVRRPGGDRVVREWSDRARPDLRPMGFGNDYLPRSHSTSRSRQKRSRSGSSFWRYQTIPASSRYTS